MSQAQIHPPPLPAARDRRRARLLAAAVFLLVGFGGALLYVIDPAGVRFIPNCPSRMLGMNCPGCGSLRATHALLHGRLATAFALNPLYLLVLPVLLFVLARQGWRVLSSRPAPPIGSALHPRWIWALFILICLYWLGRNLPWFPFTLLRPGG